MSVSSQYPSPADTQPSQNIDLLSSQEKPEAGVSWRAAEQHVLPYNLLGIVITGLIVCMSLAALDQVSILVTRYDPLTADVFTPIGHRRYSIAHNRRRTW